MNLFKFLQLLALPILALCASLNAEELKHLEGDPEVTHFLSFFISAYKTETEVEHMGEMKFALFGDAVPITVSNIITKAEQEVDGYTDSVLHRVVKDMIIQGGFLKKSAWKEYDPIKFERFPCENFDIRHVKPGRISLANTGGETNGASFFLSMAPSTPFFDDKYVAFGQLISGFDIMKSISDSPLEGETPHIEYVISKAVVMDASSVPMVLDFKRVHAEYSYFIYATIAAIVLFVAYRLKGRKVLVDLKSFKL